MTHVPTFLYAFLLGTALLAGCGNKGQLVLPGQEPKKHKSSQPAPAQPAQPKPADSSPANADAKPAQGGGQDASR